ncbi:MAG: hypothetical protein HZB76_00145 [Chlamydiae bacterium]|nr:hypothetical protein [Chlamydiota bacterium]
MFAARLAVYDPKFYGLDTYHTEKDNLNILCSKWMVGGKEKLVFIITTLIDLQPRTICCFYDSSKTPSQGDFEVHGGTPERVFRLNLNDFFNISEVFKLRPK